MPRKPRTEPFEQGSIRKIWDLWIDKWRSAKPQAMDLLEWLEQLWGTKLRMPGLYFAAPLIKVQGIGPRTIRADADVWVRTDERTPNQIEVQWIDGVHDRQFELTMSEWNSVAPLLERVEKVKGEPHPLKVLQQKRRARR
jgi:hypothetical protein